MKNEQTKMFTKEGKILIKHPEPKDKPYRNKQGELLPWEEKKYEKGDAWIKNQ